MNWDALETEALATDVMGTLRARKTSANLRATQLSVLVEQLKSSTRGSGNCLELSLTKGILENEYFITDIV